jgi:hypothetical protein
MVQNQRPRHYEDQSKAVVQRRLVEGQKGCESRRRLEAINRNKRRSSKGGDTSDEKV